MRARKRNPLIAAIVALGVLLASLPNGALAEPTAPDAPTITLIPKRPPKTLSTPSIEFSELYLFGSRVPELTARVRKLAGKRVTMVGFMVQLENPPRGGFYLSPYPASGDESGAGRGDVPPTSIFVMPEVAKGKLVAFVPGALEVTGVLDIGNKEIEGEATTIRLLLDDPKSFRFARTRSTVKSALPKTRTDNSHRH